MVIELKLPTFWGHVTNQVQKKKVSIQALQPSPHIVFRLPKQSNIRRTALNMFGGINQFQAQSTLNLNTPYQLPAFYKDY